ncbi:MAG: M48 family metallopeptidase [Syntrophomonadaceae bacterium]|jgi:predicted metal-dependent hydrolase
MRLSFQYGDTAINFEVSYSRRKTITISVETPGLVSVKAPVGLSDDEIIRRVQSKARWIVEKLYEVKNIKTIPVKKEYVNGESFMYLGRDYPLQISIDKELKQPIVTLLQGEFTVFTASRNEEPVKKAMESWYRSKATEQINERIKYYEPRVGVKPTRITVKEQKKRWGSCSSKGNLNFNWKAIMAPPSVLDYIIVHELCHLIHYNHSREFWNLVGSILPNYKTQQAWLKENGARLYL